MSYVVYGRPRQFRPLGERPPDIARNILREHKVTRPPVPVEALARHYAHVMLVPEPYVPEPGWIATVQTDTLQPNISLNARLVPEHQRFALAHALGHVLLHPPGEYVDVSLSGSVEESEANEFAVSLLAPLWMLGPLVASRPPNADELSSLFGVPRHPMNVQLASLMELPVRW